MVGARGVLVPVLRALGVALLAGVAHRPGAADDPVGARVEVLVVVVVVVVAVVVVVLVLVLVRVVGRQHVQVVVVVGLRELLALRRRGEGRPGVGQRGAADVAAARVLGGVLVVQRVVAVGEGAVDRRAGQRRARAGVLRTAGRLDGRRAAAAAEAQADADAAAARSVA